MKYETFEEAYNRAIENKEDSFEFNGCKVPLKEGEGLYEAKDYYIHNVDLSQFEGW